MRENFVEKYIENATNKIIEAYWSVDVKSKTGFEEIPDLLLQSLKGTTQYWGLKTFFENFQEKEVYLTDDDILIKDTHDAKTILNVMLGKNILVHIRVRFDLVEKIKDYFDEALDCLLYPTVCIIDWIYYEDGYLLQLRKRNSNCVDSCLRIYPDGMGVILKILEKDKYNSFYFVLSEDILKSIKEKLELKVKDIVMHQHEAYEDDREWGFAVSMKYGLLWKYPDAEKRLQPGNIYEDKEYSDDEYKIEIVNQIFSDKNIKNAWIKEFY